MHGIVMVDMSAVLGIKVMKRIVQNNVLLRVIGGVKQVKNVFQIHGCAMVTMNAEMEIYQMSKIIALKHVL